MSETTTPPSSTAATSATPAAAPARVKPVEYLCTVEHMRMLTPTVFETAFETDKPLEFKGGQFISIIIPGAGPNGRDLRRAYSIASDPKVRPVELCIKLVEGGPGTNYLYKLKAGDQFRGLAPYGDFVYKTSSTRHAIFIATGTGIAPFRSMLLSDAYQGQKPKSATVLLGVRTEDELLYTECLAKTEGLKWVSAVSQPTSAWTGFKGRVTDVMRDPASGIDWLNTDYYLCGNGQMITEIKTLLAEKGVEKSAIHQEKYY